MPIYILMTRLGPDAMKDPRGRRAVGREWIKKVKELSPGVRFLAHYAILGPYDFMDIYEAPNERVAHEVSMLSRSEGAANAESWQALPYEDYLPLVEAVEKVTG